MNSSSNSTSIPSPSSSSSSSSSSSYKKSNTLIDLSFALEAVSPKVKFSATIAAGTFSTIPFSAGAIISSICSTSSTCFVLHKPSIVDKFTLDVSGDCVMRMRESI